MALSNFYLTDKGNALLARAQAGTTLTITRAQVGEGTWPEGTTYANIAALVKPVKYLSIVSKSQSSGQVKITVQFSNSGVGRVFQWTEFGLWAADPDYPDDRSRDILYGTAYAGDTPVPIESALTEFLFNVLVKTGQAANVTVTIDSSLIYLTQESLDSTLEALKGQANGLAELGEDGKVPEDQLPEMDYDPAGSAAAVKEELEADLATRMQHIGNITKYDTVLAAASALTVDGTFFGDPSSSIYNAEDKPPNTTDVQYFVMLDGTTGRRVVLAVGYASSAAGRFVGTRDILNGAWLNDWVELIGRYDLTASDDLNNIKKSGFYRLKGVTSNIPTGCSWGVMAVCGDGSNTLSQMATNHLGTNTYMRTYHDGTTWSEWKQIATTDSVLNINQLNSAGLDCNALIKAGRYQMQGQLFNSPPWIGTSYGHFYVEVFWHMDIWVRQVAYEANSNRVYTRLCHDGIWDPWERIATMTSDPSTAGARAISVGTTDLTAGSSALATGQIHLVYG